MKKVIQPQNGNLKNVSDKAKNVAKDNVGDANATPSTVTMSSKMHTPTKLDDLKVEMKAGVGGMKHPGETAVLFLTSKVDL